MSTGGKPSERERAQADAFRAEVAALPPLPEGRTESERAWLANRAALRRRAQQSDPRFFLHWPVVRATMFVGPSASYVAEVELPAAETTGWTLDEDEPGRPLLMHGQATSANLAHNAYHLVRFQEATGRSIGSFPHVVEIGGGYGSMARLLHRLTAADLTVVDLPEFSALQRYFLGLLGIPAQLVGGPPARRAGTLVLATWSVSEMPAADRAALLDGDAFLIAHQSRFGEVDNERFFREWAASRPDVQWTVEPIDHLPGNHYLFGVSA